ncbi:chloride channel CLIC-like protein 1 [Syngnathoides biaculeatus]|uniref:chloride channel CLIC-like protein 1 n=1 Tax=Syngnathoides biaculeatus TaxID=300417 RepID=UPI002ADDE49D|nr:chloride channel CLIC-like protein 1 [Syngnathoides biaculeatus]
MFLVFLLGYLTLASGQQLDEDWIDPYDLLNYDASTKTMRKPAEQPVRDLNVPTSRRGLVDCGQPELSVCTQQLTDLQTQVEAQKKSMKQISQQPTCNPVFKRFLSRLVKDIQRVKKTQPTDCVDYDATIRVSRQALAEIQTFLDREDGCRTGALDNAISQILVDLRPHDYEAWRWRFEDTFGIDLDTVFKLAVSVLIFVVIICTQLWSYISWLVQFKRFFTICFFVSIIWNWLYLYKIAFAEHQRNIVKMESINDKCTGIRTIDWHDSLKEWYRSTWTLQDDPCKKYYEVLIVDPILLVPPTKALSVTITTFITEPLKHVGLGISEFLRALLKDLPITLQIPVLLTIVLAIVVFMYGSVQAVFQYGITAPLRRRRRDPPLPQPEHSALQEIEDRGYMEGEVTPQSCPRRSADQARLHRNPSCRTRASEAREELARMFVETLTTAASSHTQHKLDGKCHVRHVEAGQGDGSDTRVDSDSDNHAEKQRRGSSVLVSQPDPKRKTKPTCRDSAHPEDDNAGERMLTRLPQTQTKENEKNAKASAGDSTPSGLLMDVETVGTPVQDTLPAAL